MTPLGWNLLGWRTLDRLDSIGLGGERRQAAAFRGDCDTVAAELVCLKLAQLLSGWHAERLWTDCCRLPRCSAVDS